ncbi:MAG TPA: hypothetical protein VGP73_01880 [Thermoanaerobaculia bacterium]
MKQLFSKIQLLLLSTALLLPALALARPVQSKLVAPPGPVTDPDGKQPARYSLPMVLLDHGGSIKVTMGEAYYEQAIVVWRVDTHAAIVQVGQLNRGSNAKGRPEGDGGGRPQSLVLNAAGTYYFQCWHKIQDPRNKKDITEIGWTASYERLTGDNQNGYTLACEDSSDSDFNDIVAEIKPNK